MLTCIASIHLCWHISRPEALPYRIEVLRSSAACPAVRYQLSLRRMAI